MAKHKKKTKVRAGHRSWAPKMGPAPGGHSGDNMSPEKRRALMSRIRSTNTGPERTMMSLLDNKKIKYEKYAKDLPGKPDIVFRKEKIAVFIDGDFWHGWRFPLWQHKLSQAWKEKIEGNRKRDQRNFRKLRSKGWKVLRIWEHQVEKNPDRYIKKIIYLYRECYSKSSGSSSR